MGLPQRLPLAMMQSQWASQLDPVLSNPLNQASLLKNVSLSIGNNNVNTLLGRNLQGWVIVRKRASADIYDTQDSNPTPSLTLQLVSSAAVVVDLMVF